MAVDLLCKLAIATIHLGRSEIVDDTVKSICSHNPADTGMCKNVELFEFLVQAWPCIVQ